MKTAAQKKAETEGKAVDTDNPNAAVGTVDAADATTVDKILNLTPGRRYVLRASDDYVICVYRLPGNSGFRVEAGWRLDEGYGPDLSAQTPNPFGFGPGMPKGQATREAPNAAEAAEIVDAWAGADGQPDDPLAAISLDSAMVINTRQEDLRKKAGY